MKKNEINLHLHNCEIENGVLKCCGCGDTLESPKSEMSFQDHWMTIYGFAEYHKKCVENENEPT